MFGHASFLSIILIDITKINYFCVECTIAKSNFAFILPCFGSAYPSAGYHIVIYKREGKKPQKSCLIVTSFSTTRGWFRSCHKGSFKAFPSSLCDMTKKLLTHVQNVLFRLKGLSTSPLWKGKGKHKKYFCLEKFNSVFCIIPIAKTFQNIKP